MPYIIRDKEGKPRVIIQDVVANNIMHAARYDIKKQAHVFFLDGNTSNSTLLAYWHAGDYMREVNTDRAIVG